MLTRRNVAPHPSEGDADEGPYRIGAPPSQAVFPGRSNPHGVRGRAARGLEHGVCWHGCCMVHAVHGPRGVELPCRLCLMRRACRYGMVWYGMADCPDDRPGAQTVSLGDIGTYGSLCALATLNRADLHRMVLTNPGCVTCPPRPGEAPSAANVVSGHGPRAPPPAGSSISWRMCLWSASWSVTSTMRGTRPSSAYLAP
jgi:disulfide bond formation protein DsbB